VGGWTPPIQRGACRFTSSIPFLKAKITAYRRPFQTKLSTAAGDPPTGQCASGLSVTARADIFLNDSLVSIDRPESKDSYGDLRMTVR